MRRALITLVLASIFVGVVASRSNTFTETDATNTTVIYGFHAAYDDPVELVLLH